MRILIANDDGIYSPGLCALAEAASRFGEVRIVAPDVEQSSMSHAITASRPLSYRRVPMKGFEAYKVNGTPADCVALGAYNWEKVDVVLSGVNLGPNLGNAVWHSGTLDGEDVSGRYLLVEALNIGLIGPNLFLAPDADPGDGSLDFVLLAEDKRAEFDEYLTYRLEGKQEAPYLHVRRGRRLNFAWDGPTLHFDDEVWPKKEKKRKKILDEAHPDDPPTVEITVERGGLEFLIPHGGDSPR